jgi:hypothetical protein
MKKNEDYPINIWDDYYEDGYVPENEIQETYIYVEDSELYLEERKDVLEILLDFMQNESKFIDDNVKLWMNFYDSKEKYPTLCDSEYENLHFQRWEIRVENLSHENRYKLVDELNDADLSLNGVPFNIYSES